MDRGRRRSVTKKYEKMTIDEAIIKQHVWHKIKFLSRVLIKHDKHRERLMLEKLRNNRDKQ